MRNAVVAVVLLGSVAVACGGGEKSPPSSPDGEGGTRTREDVTVRAPDENTTRRGSPLTEEVLAAVRAHPSVAERRTGDVVLQRPVGDPALVSVAEVAGGATRVRVRVVVERRDGAQTEARTWAVVLDVRVGADGHPAAVAVVGEEDPEFLALFGE